MFAMAAFLLVSCDKDEPTADSSFSMKASDADYGSTVCARIDTIVSGDLTLANGPHVWDNTHNWIISGVVRVKGGAVLTIDPGTFISADPAVTTGANGVLVITKTGKIDAEGTAEAPIVFTSHKLLDCNAATIAAPGDFGGVILLGDAQVNTGSVTNVIEGLGDQPNVSDFYFGSTTTANNNQDSGILKYVRIEFAGRVLPTDGDNGVEINGLTLGGVGSGTTLDFIQVSYGLDDAFEFFGGTVNAAHLIAFTQDDDGFDFDWGYTGIITRAVAIANRKATHSGIPTPGVSDSNGIELDNNAAGTTVTPRTRPTINYLSIFGPSSSSTYANLYENGIHVRRAGRINLNNSTVSGYGFSTTNSRGIFLDGATVAGTFTNVEVDAFTTPPTTPAALTGVTGTTSATASAFGTSQPFYNNGSLNFSTAARTNGAFATGDSSWIGSWAKFTNFVTANE